MNVVCQAGGGIIQEHHFRYVSDKALMDIRPPWRGSNPLQFREATVTAPKQVVQAAAAAIGAIAKSVPMVIPAARAPPLPQHFDLSTLKQVRKKTTQGTRPQKIIEVVELCSGKVMVCFRGPTDACRSLELERRDVAEACEAYGTEAQVSFGTFTLRYAKPGAQVAAYEFGAHKDDFKRRRESHEERWYRFRQVYEQEKAEGKLGYAPNLPNASSRETQASPFTPGRSRQSHFSYNNTARLAESAAHIAPSVDMQECRPPNTDMTCIICQAKKAQIVFQPCSHCLLCSECASFSCRRFCPLCRAPIARRDQPSKVRIVQPRIFSAYCFM